MKEVDTSVAASSPAGALVSCCPVVAMSVSSWTMRLSRSAILSSSPFRTVSLLLALSCSTSLERRPLAEVSWSESSSRLTLIDFTSRAVSGDVTV
jgi:hypothetical protein